ncbi:hypothetical protein DVH24_020327 [Malus domestica]|uniref:Uncharacterized protein n=1 Tax=Malus domestica TaxID=3750 RepID=A0A498JB16_MALDO|nr:hypothetical protein DVH24_020327 [Malus domestica]
MQVAAFRIVSKNLLNPPKKSLSTRTRIIDHHTRHVIVPTQKRQITNRQPHDDGHEHSAVKRHDRQHNHVPDRRVDSEKHALRQPPRREPYSGAAELGGEQWGRDRRVGRGFQGRRGGRALDAHAQGLEVLVEGRDEEAGKQREGVAGPRIGFPRVEEERYLPAPVEGHVHHLLRFLERESRSGGFLEKKTCQRRARNLEKWKV